MKKTHIIIFIFLLIAIIILLSINYKNKIKEQKQLEYEAHISTMRWDLISEKGQFKRTEIANTDYINYLKV